MDSDERNHSRHGRNRHEKQRQKGEETHRGGKHGYSRPYVVRGNTEPVLADWGQGVVGRALAGQDRPRSSCAQGDQGMASKRQEMQPAGDFPTFSQPTDPRTQGPTEPKLKWAPAGTTVEPKRGFRLAPSVKPTA
jgi:hypothetical protein